MSVRGGSALPYRIETRLEDACTTILATGDVSAVDIRNSVLQALAAAQGAGLSNLLVDMSGIGGLPPTSELYEVHLEMFGVQAAREPRIATAMIVRADQAPEMQFYADLAANRGVAYRLFSDYAQAMAWFRHGLD